CSPRLGGLGGVHSRTVALLRWILRRLQRLCRCQSLCLQLLWSLQPSFELLVEEMKKQTWFKESNLGLKFLLLCEID
ncbi:hypothetical protein AVEN_188515-1, partial [Araneus ventricosus]